MGYYETRYFSKCIFCLRNNREVKLTSEHIFGKSIRKKISTEGNYISGKKKKGNCPISNITLKALCETCNRDILGTHIMKPVTKVMVALFSGKEKYIKNTQLDLVKNYFLRLGILMDIASSNYNITSESQRQKVLNNTNSKLVKFNPIISDSERQSFIETFEAPKISIEVAHYIGNDDFGKRGPLTIRSSADLHKADQEYTRIISTKEFIMVYHKLAFIIQVGGSKDWGNYPGFKSLPSFYQKDKFILPNIDFYEITDFFEKNIMSGPMRKNILRID